MQSDGYSLLICRQEAKGDAIDVFAFFENEKMVCSDWPMINGQNPVVEAIQEEVKKLEDEKAIARKETNLIANKPRADTHIPLVRSGSKPISRALFIELI